MARIQEFIKNNKNKILIGVIVVVVVALPIIISQVLKQQNTQQHAESAPAISLSLTTQSPDISQFPTPLPTLFPSPSYPIPPYIPPLKVTLTMDASTNDIGSLQFNLKYNDTSYSFGTVSSDNFTITNKKRLSPGVEQIILLNPTINQIRGSNITVATFTFYPKTPYFYNEPSQTPAPTMDNTVSIDPNTVNATATGVSTFVPVSSTTINNAPQENLSPTPTQTLSPTPTPIPSPTPTLAPNETVIEGLILLPGISDNGGNRNPKHTIRKVYYQIFDSQNKKVNEGSQNATFTTTPPMGGNPGFYARYSTVLPLPEGSYTAKIRMNGTLWKKLPMTISVKNHTVNTIGSETLVTGDFGNTNSLDVSDYTLLVSCYKEASSCTADDKTATDLNDDGNVDEADLNILQRGFAIRNGD